MGCEAPSGCSGTPSARIRLTRKLVAEDDDDDDEAKSEKSDVDGVFSMFPVAVHAYNATKGASYCTSLNTSSNVCPNMLIVGESITRSQMCLRTLSRRAAITLLVVSNVVLYSPTGIPPGPGMGIQDQD